MQASPSSLDLSFYMLNLCFKYYILFFRFRGPTTILEALADTVDRVSSVLILIPTYQNETSPLLGCIYVLQPLNSYF